MTYDYRVFGLYIQSDLLVPEFEPCNQSARVERLPDIEICITQMPSRVAALTPHGEYMGIGSGACLFKVPNVARYLVEDGSRIYVEPVPGSSPLEVRAYLLGTALGAALHQRQMIPLHVSVVRSPRGLLAFSGPSGSGKSTIAAALHIHHGWPILTDDLAVLSGLSRSPSLCFGVRRLRLWKDAIAELEVAGLPTSRVIDREDKFQFELINSNEKNHDCNLHSVFLLRNAPELSIMPIRGSAALIALSQCIYRADLAGLFNKATPTLSALAHASNTIETNYLSRPIPNIPIRDAAAYVAGWCDDSS